MIEAQLTLQFQKPAVKIEAGAKFGRLTLISKTTPSNSGDIRWICRCDCGTEKPFILSAIVRGPKKQSCGCIRVAKLVRCSTTHGQTGSPEHVIWKGIKQRCYNENNAKYYRYGGLGIVMCDRWRDSFENFFADMGARPSPKLTVERKDGKLGYSPENCVWDTRKVQANNKADNVRLTFQGETLTMAQWAERKSLNCFTLAKRLNNYGWTIEKALTTPARFMLQWRLSRSVSAGVQA